MMYEQAVQIIRNGILQTPSTDVLAQESPIAFEFNGLSHVVMMASPNDLEDFAIGFSFTEGIIQQRSDVYNMDIEHNQAGIVLRINIATERFAQLKDKRRTLMGRTGCGICGIESLDYFQNQKPPAQTIKNQFSLDLAILDSVLSAFDTSQPLRDQTGATHAAAWVSWRGEIQLVREDVGRHNALDKLIGGLMQQSINPHNGFILISSRASFEMVDKIACWGATCLVAVSAATSRAFQCAVDNNIQLIGFARPNRAVQYHFGANL